VPSSHWDGYTIDEKEKIQYPGDDRSLRPTRRPELRKKYKIIITTLYRLYTMMPSKHGATHVPVIKTRRRNVIIIKRSAVQYRWFPSTLRIRPILGYLRQNCGFIFNKHWRPQQRFKRKLFFVRQLSEMYCRPLVHCKRYTGSWYTTATLFGHRGCHRNVPQNWRVDDRLNIVICVLLNFCEGKKLKANTTTTGLYDRSAEIS